MQRASFYDLFSDFEGTIVLPEISYRDWVLPKVSDQEKFLAEYENRLNLAKKEQSAEAWKNYLALYSGLFAAKDFSEISSKYSLNRMFESWCRRFLKTRGYDRLDLTVVTRGFAPIVKNFFSRPDIAKILRDLKIAPSRIIGSEPEIDRRGLMQGLKSVVYSKKKFVKDGHIMLGDEGEEREFAAYPYFVDLSKWQQRVE